MFSFINVIDRVRFPPHPNSTKIPNVFLNNMIFEDIAHHIDFTILFTRCSYTLTCLSVIQTITTIVP